MARVSVFKLGNHAVPGTPVDMSTYLTSVKMPRKADTAETTTMGNSSKSHLAGLKDGTISVEGKFDPTVDAWLAALLGDTVPVSFEYGPAGTTAPAPKKTGTCICTAYDITGGVGDAVGFSAEFQITGVVTDGVYS